MFVRFKQDTMIGATVHMAGALHDCDAELCKQLVADGKAEEVEPPVRPGGEHPAHRDDRIEQHERLKEAEAIESGASLGPSQARQATALRQQFRSDSIRTRTTDPERYKDIEPGTSEMTDQGGGVQTGVVVNPAEKVEEKHEAKHKGK